MAKVFNKIETDGITTSAEMDKYASEHWDDIIGDEENKTKDTKNETKTDKDKETDDKMNVKTNQKHLLLKPLIVNIMILKLRLKQKTNQNSQTKKLMIKKRIVTTQRLKLKIAKLLQKNN